MNCQHTPDVLLDCLANQAVLYPLPFRKVSGLEPAAVSGSFSSQRSPLPEETPSTCLGNAQDRRGACWFLSPCRCVCVALGRGMLVRMETTLQILQVKFWL